MTARRFRLPVLSTRVRAALLLLLLVGVVAWAWWSASLAYDFANPAAREMLRNDLPCYLDVFRHLPVGLPRIGAGLLFLVSALGLGFVALSPLRLRWQSVEERALLEVAAGLMVWTYLTLALGSACLLRRGVFLCPLAAGLAAAGWGWLRRPWASGEAPEAPRDEPPEGRGSTWPRLPVLLVVTLLLVLFLYLALLGALGPEVQFDGRWYHLAQAKHYVQSGCLYNMVAETLNIVTAFPANHQLLLTGVATLFDLRVAKLFTWFECLLAVAMVILLGRHHFRSLVIGLVAALLFVSTPIISWLASTSGNDLEVVLLSLVAVHVYLRWRVEPAAGWLVLLGALGGFAAGVKVQALAFVFVLVLLVLLESCSLKVAGSTGRGRWRKMVASLALVASAGLAADTPWLVRSYVTTGNPTYPLLDGLVFDSPYWNDLIRKNYEDSVRRDGVEITPAWYLSLPVRTVTRANNHRAIIGPLFLFLCPALAVTVLTVRGARGPVVRRLALFAGAGVTVLFAAGLADTRYLAFAIPELALLAAFALVEHRWLGGIGRVLRVTLTLVAFGVTILNLQPFLVFLVHSMSPGVSGRAYIPWEYLYRGAPETSLGVDTLPMHSYLNHHLTPGVDKVYDAAGGRLVVFYLFSDVELFNGDTWSGAQGLFGWSLCSPDAEQHLRRERITHVVVDRVHWPESRLEMCAVSEALHEVWSSDDGLVLYRFDSEGRGDTPPAKRAPDQPPALFEDGFDSGGTSLWRVPPR